MTESATLVIIGSGPAGYTAAIYAARAKLEPILYAGHTKGGQLMFTGDIENFPGFKDGIPGAELMINMQQQAERFGTELRHQFVTAVDFTEKPFKLWTNLPEGVTSQKFKESSPQELAAIQDKIRQQKPALTAQAVIITTGAVARKLGIPGENKFLGRGVCTCAICDAAFYQDKITYVVGGGDSAMEDTLALAKFAKEVHVVHRRDEFRASKIMQDRVLNHDKVKVWWNSEVKAILGENKVEGLTIDRAGELINVKADGLFLAIGHRPNSLTFAGQLEIDAHGYIVTRQSPSWAGVTAASQCLIEGEALLPYPSMTSVPGVFAAGDVVDLRYMQAITAAGQGAAAALDAERWLERQTDNK